MTRVLAQTAKEGRRSVKKPELSYTPPTLFRLENFNFSFGYGTIRVYAEYAYIWGFWIEAVRENDIEIATTLRPFNVTSGWVSLRFWMGMIINHIAIILINIIINAYHIGFADNREIIGELGGIRRWIILDHQFTLTTKRSTGFVRITSHDMRNHLAIKSFGNTYNKTSFSYHKIFASKSSSSVSNSRVHRSSLRYFHPPSARIVTILPRSILAATRIAACRDAPQEGPAKMPS